RKARTSTTAVTISARDRRDDDRGGGGMLRGGWSNISLMLCFFSSFGLLRLVLERGGQQLQQPGHQVRPADDRLVVVVGAQSQSAVGRTGTGRARHDADLLPVGVLGGEPRRGGGVLRDVLVGAGRQHQPLD